MHYNGIVDDPTDQMLTGWDEARPDLEVGTLQVTARLSRIGAAPRQAAGSDLQPLRVGPWRGRTAERAAHRRAALSIVPDPPGKGTHALVGGRDEPDRSTRAPRPRPSPGRSQRSTGSRDRADRCRPRDRRFGRGCQLGERAPAPRSARSGRGRRPRRDPSQAPGWSRAAGLIGRRPKTGVDGSGVPPSHVHPHPGQQLSTRSGWRDQENRHESEDHAHGRRGGGHRGIDRGARLRPRPRPSGPR